MPAKVVLLLLALVFAAGRAHGQAEPALTVYREADNLFNSTHPTDLTDSLALNGFEKVIQLLIKTSPAQGDTLLFQSYLKKGILLDVRNDIEEGKQAYLQAIKLHGLANRQSDSLLFRPYVYAGADYFNLNNFDSANYCLLQAERLVQQFPSIPETERLYNSLGALHYVNGNYLQSKKVCAAFMASC